MIIHAMKLKNSNTKENKGAPGRMVELL